MITADDREGVKAAKAQRVRACMDVSDELSRIVCAHSPIHSPHEGLGLVLMRVDALRNEINNGGDTKALRHKAMQVAAMAIRFMADVC